MKFTDTKIAALNVEKDTQLVDDSLPCLGLRVYKSGRKTFVFRVWDTSTKRWQRKTLGLFPGITCAEARVASLELLQSHHSKKRKCNLTVLAAYDEWHNIMKAQDVSDGWLYRINLVRTQLQPLHHKPLAELTRRDCLRLQTHIYNKDGQSDPTAKHNRARTANQVLQILQRILNHYELNPSPAKTKRYKESVRQSYLEPEQLKKLLEYAFKSDDIGAHLFITALFTGARKSNVLQMRWDEFQNDVWVIPEYKFKTRKEHTLYLTAPVLKILEHRRDNLSPYVFPSVDNPLQPWNDYRKAFNRLSKATGARQFTMHELRHTFTTYAIASGLSGGIVSQMLGHTSGGDSRLTAGAARVTMQVYAHSVPNAVRDGFEKTAEFICTAMESTPKQDACMGLAG